MDDDEFDALIGDQEEFADFDDIVKPADRHGDDSLLSHGEQPLLGIAQRQQRRTVFAGSQVHFGLAVFVAEG
jgi:hypothetical protein